ncbi:MAG TPA: hypothetical protein DD490_04785 [Acidobacteria bacterium]|nr:hypothetical protein [Acidobacteriota bacterium]
MCRTLFRCAVAAAFVLALILTTVPAHARPLDAGSPALFADVSWLDAALNWLQSLLGDKGVEPVQRMTAGSLEIPPPAGMDTGSCIDPMGGGCNPGGAGGWM